MSALRIAGYVSLVVAGCCGLSLVSYAVARRVLLARADAQTTDLAGVVITKIATLHSLLLALVFAQELLNLNVARETMTREAGLIGNVYYDLARYGGHETASARAALFAYTTIVLQREWHTLGVSKRLDEGAWDQWKSAYEGILDLVPTSPRQESLRHMMLEHIREISTLRIKREYAALVGRSHTLFLIAAITGIVLISVGYFPFPPTRVNLALLAMFGAYTGIILYLIFEFANPYSGVGSIEPTRIQRLLEGMQQTPK